jgi:hypothetical protein
MFSCYNFQFDCNCGLYIYTFHELLNGNRNMEWCKSSVVKVVEYRFFCPNNNDSENTQFIELASGFVLAKFEREEVMSKLFLYGPVFNQGWNFIAEHWWWNHFFTHKWNTRLCSVRIGYTSLLGGIQNCHWFDRIFHTWWIAVRSVIVLQTVAGLKDRKGYSVEV